MKLYAPFFAITHLIVSLKFWLSIQVVCPLQNLFDFTALTAVLPVMQKIYNQGLMQAIVCN